jgi:hypothetical protein
MGSIEKWFAAFAIAAGASLVAGHALAGDEHEASFQDADAFVDRDGALHIRFVEETGLRQRVDMRAAASARAVYRCADQDGAVLGSRMDRQVVRRELIKRREIFGFGGRIRGEMVLDVPPAEHGDCPGAHRPVLVRVVYQDVRLADLTHGIHLRLPGRHVQRFRFRGYEERWDRDD